MRARPGTGLGWSGALAILLATALASGCLGGGDEDRVVVGTTTTVQDSGLLDVLVAAFERDTGIRARAVVGGSGEIVEKARRGDVDVLLTHSPERERALVEEGVALSRTVVMRNRFVLAGPDADPAGLRGAANASDALARVHANASLFASRGDGSGTHDKEVALWRAAGLDPASLGRAWYKETGSGQAPTLLFADERGAYALADEATLLQLRAAGRVAGLVDLGVRDPALVNEYAVTRLVGAARADLADAFASWLAGPQGQAAVASHRAGGSQVFSPAAEG
ncbi:MAG TPA: substrate-binding domain-containing protein [Candidatus Thermoplasmatota archaeon]|nr:substrate-binding domain-containing protein [Candidatus Thermoplasmatota archaeon]